MSLDPGTRLGPYEILAPLGAGGMGAVYKARDTRVDRIVAIKVSADRFTDRFEREAHAIAALNHPNICTLYDVGPNYLVMEYVEGKPLAGPLPAAEALRLALQIADALDAAHRKRIVHRDLKPANILLARSGVKVLDFGLAKMERSAGAAAEATVTLAKTQEGVIVGTLPYSAPEQLEGKDADPRSDIFSFGCVLYELLTGKRAFHGATAASVITAVMSVEPPRIDPPHGAIPPALDRLMRSCLAKDPDARWQCAADLKQALALVASSAPSAVPELVSAPARRFRRWWIAAALAAAAFLALLVVAVVHWRETPPPAEVTRFSLFGPPGGGSLTYSVTSPDGRRIALIAGGRLWVRPFDSPEPRLLNGTEGAGIPFWSPDSKSVAFVAGRGQLKRVDVAGGPPLTLAEVNTNLPGAWSADGTILIGLLGGGLQRVPASGGAMAPVTTPDRSRGETRHLWPQFLPGTRRFLYIAGSDKPGMSMLYAASLDSPARTAIMPVESNFFFAASPEDSSRGYLLFLRDRTLMAQPFDVRKLRTTGDAFPAAENIAFNTALGAALRIGLYSASSDTLVYRADAPTNAQLMWFDRSGRQLQEIGPVAAVRPAAVFPDGQRAVVPIDDSANGVSDLWLIDGARGTTSRLTFDRNRHLDPVLSPDGSRVAFSAYRGSTLNLFQVSTSGVGGPELLLQSDLNCYPTDWSRDGRYLAYFALAANTREDIWVLPLEGERKPFPVVQGPARDAGAHFSPDGKWLAYVSDESGRSEVYVLPFTPGKPASGKWQVSINGAGAPFWRADGKELYFISQGKLMAVEVATAGDRFQSGPPKPLFPIRDAITGYAPSADGQRFLMGVISAQQAAPSMTVVLNWMSALRK